MKFKSVVMDEIAFGRAIVRGAHQILEKNENAD